MDRYLREKITNKNKNVLVHKISRSKEFLPPNGKNVSLEEPQNKARTLVFAGIYCEMRRRAPCCPAARTSELARSWVHSCPTHDKIMCDQV